jgi:aquaporin Z
MRRYLAELVGTFLFVVSVFGAVLSGSTLAPVAIGAALMVLVYATAHLSGAHLNPAVSLGVFLRGRLRAGDLLPYVAAQLLGAAAAWLVALAVWNDELRAITALDLENEVMATVVAEIVFTFALVYVVLNVATSRDHEGNSFYGLAIGFTVLAGAVAVGSVSGGAFNPAVVFGLTVGGLLAWKWIWVYLVAQLAAGAAAAYTFKALNPADR